MNSSRLSELERQRALVREQLAWLEREIARETAAIAKAPSPTAAGTAAPALTGGSLAARSAASVPESASRGAAGAETTSAQAATLLDHEPDPKNTAQEARRGCLLAAVGVFVLIVAAFLAIYFWRYSDRPLLFQSRSGEAVKK